MQLDLPEERTGTGNPRLRRLSSSVSSSRLLAHVFASEESHLAPRRPRASRACFRRRCSAPGVDSRRRIIPREIVSTAHGRSPESRENRGDGLRSRYFFFCLARFFFRTFLSVVSLVPESTLNQHVSLSTHGGTAAFFGLGERRGLPGREYSFFFFFFFANTEKIDRDSVAAARYNRRYREYNGQRRSRRRCRCGRKREKPSVMRSRRRSR